MPAARHDHVRVAFAGLDELQMHRLHRREILIDNLVQRPPAVPGVSLQPPNQPNVGVGIDEDFDITQIPHVVVDE